MKLAKKYQEGGFMTYQPLPLIPDSQGTPQINQSQQPSTGGDMDSTGSPLSDKVKQKMYGEALTNDAYAYEGRLKDAYVRYANMSEAERNTMLGRQLKDQMTSNFADINALKRSKIQYTQAESVVGKQNAFSEPAIMDGRMVVKSQQGITTITPEQYAEDIKKGQSRQYQVLSNSELLRAREFDKTLVGNDKVFESLNQSIGMDKIKHQVLQSLSSIGSVSSNNTNSTMLLGSQAGAMLGAKEIVEAAKNGIFTLKRTLDKTSNSENVKLAINAAWDNLSENARTVLKARAASTGVDPSKVTEVAHEMMAKLLLPKTTTSETNKQDINYEGALTTAIGKGSAADTKFTGSVGPNEMITSLSNSGSFGTINTGTSTNINSMMYNNGALRDGSMAPYGVTTLDKVNTLPDLVNINNLYFGDKPISTGDLNSIQYRGEATTTMELPAVESPNGGFRPAFEYMAAFNEAQKEIKSLKNPSPEAKRQIYAKKGLGNVPIKYFLGIPTYLTAQNDATKDNIWIDNQKNRPGYEASKSMYDKQYLENPDHKGWGGAYSISGLKWLRDQDVYKGMVFGYIDPNNAIQGRWADKNAASVSKSENTVGFYQQPFNENKVYDPNSMFNQGSQQRTFTQKDL